MIRERLDGTFTRLLPSGQIEVVEVDHDYIPGHGSIGRPLGVANTKPQVSWTEEEEELLCQMRRLGRPFNEIAWLLNRSEDSAKKRHRLLRVKGTTA